MRFVANGAKRGSYREARAAAQRYEPFHRLDWNASVAHRFLRAVGTRTLDLGRGAKLSRNALEALRSEQPIDRRTAGSLLGRVMRGSESRSSWRIEDFVYLLEAIAGAAEVSGMILDRLERISVEAWREDRHDPPEVVYHLGHLWLRIHAQTVDMHRARASALWSRMARAAPRSWLTRALDVVLHGAVGAGRSAETLAPGVKNPRFFTHVTDDPGTVVRCIRKAGLGDRYWVPDARLAFLGGEEVIHAFARSWRGMKTGAQQRLFVETAGFIRSPFIDRMLEEMSVSSRARRAAKAMLARRRAPT